MPYPLPEYRGEYKMEGRLGESGSGPVYSARDALGRALAIKVLTGPLAADPGLPDRLHAETKLEHKNILPILALFRNKERICIVTEFLEGKNLRDLVTGDQSLSLLERVEIMTQAGDALRYAHANGIAHRGLKPSRIHVQPDGAVKVRNFSIDLPPEAAQSPEAVQYMAPEQKAGKPVDALCNIFTYGVILGELTSNSPEHPRLLTGILQRATHRDREARYQSFNELLADVARLLVRLRNTDLEFTGLFESASPPQVDQSQVQENVQFTVYRPRAVRPGEWKTLLAFAHLSERPADAPEDEPDPIKDVQQRANQLLGKDAAQYQDLRQDSSVPIPHEGELTFVPEMNGIEFNPRRLSFLWQESVHQAAFRLRASPQMDGQTVRGQMCVYLGSIIVAQVPLRIEVNSQRIFQAAEEALAPVTAARYRKIFACYSHKDVAVVEELERYGRAMGDEYLRDVVSLRSGEMWNDRVLRMIDQASVFQLFWSSNSIRSPYVRQEWQYALTLNRDTFVRPVYWEDPLPEARELNLPPEELRSLHFHRVAPGIAATPEVPAVTGSFAVTAAFTGQFQAPVAGSKPAPPAPSSPPAEGEFTRMFQSPGPRPSSLGDSAPGTEASQGEFTREFGAQNPAGPMPRPRDIPVAPPSDPPTSNPLSAGATETFATRQPVPPPLPPRKEPGGPTRAFSVPAPLPTLGPPVSGGYTPAPSRGTHAPRRISRLMWAAAALVMLGVGGLSWYGVRRIDANRAAKLEDARRRMPPEVNPEPQAVPAPVSPDPEPTVEPAPGKDAPPPIPEPVVTAPEPHYALMLWSRGTPILPDLVIRGDDPFLQASFTLDGTVLPDASIQVEWYLNGVPAGVTDFDPSEKGKHKNYTIPPREGNYTALLLVNRKAVASLAFSYRK